MSWGIECDIEIQLYWTKHKIMYDSIFEFMNEFNFKLYYD